MDVLILPSVINSLEYFKFFLYSYIVMYVCVTKVGREIGRELRYQPHSRSFFLWRTMTQLYLTHKPQVPTHNQETRSWQGHCKFRALTITTTQWESRVWLRAKPSYTELTLSLYHCGEEGILYAHLKACFMDEGSEALRVREVPGSHH